MSHNSLCLSEIWQRAATEALRDNSQAVIGTTQPRPYQAMAAFL
jgi:hypothetical protein